MLHNDDSHVIVNKNVLPEVFIKVLEAKNLLEQGKCKTVLEACLAVQLSRSAFYKYKDACHTLYEKKRGATITIAMSLLHEPGLLSNILNLIAQASGNILTINQNIPINGQANVTITLETDTLKTDLNEMMEMIRAEKGVIHFKIIARE